MKISADQAPAGHVLGRYNLAGTVHITPAGPYEGPVCGANQMRLWSIVIDDEKRNLCRSCRRWLDSKKSGQARQSTRPAGH